MDRVEELPVMAWTDEGDKVPIAQVDALPVMAMKIDRLTVPTLPVAIVPSS
jgi:hypothetical protein